MNDLTALANYNRLCFHMSMVHYRLLLVRLGVKKRY